MDKSILSDYRTRQEVSSSINNSKLFYMGFELELVESPDGVSDSELRDLVSGGQDLGLLVKYDGSVDAELVSMPLLKEDLKLKLSQTLDCINASSNNWLSWDQGSEDFKGGRCGFHLHVNRKAIHNVRAIFDFIKRYSEDFKRLYGRINTFYCRLDPYYMDQNYEKNHSYRYSSINNLNSHTVEFRLWRGSLNYDRLCFYIDLTYTLCRYSRHLDRLSLADIFFLMDNQFGDHLIEHFQDYLPFTSLQVIKRFFAFKHYQKNLRNLTKLKNLEKKHDQRMIDWFKKQDQSMLESVDQSDQSDQLTVFNF